MLKWGIPERDIWSLCVMVQGPYQMGRVVGTSSSPPSVVIWKFRLTFRPGNYILSFSYGFVVVVSDIWEWRPGFYTEFRYTSYEHSGLAWGAILRKLLVLTLFPRLPCSFFREHVPKIDFFLNVPRQQGAFKYGPWGPYMDCLPEIYGLTVHIYIYIYIYIWTFFQKWTDRRWSTDVIPVSA